MLDLVGRSREGHWSLGPQQCARVVLQHSTSPLSIVPDAALGRS
ncbi:MAG TPA: hypothetical protein VNQ53_07465 [Nocardioides sp.]|nr:hypothetical protein [Nocardioides sp.]